MFEGRGDTFEVLDWPQADEKIEKLPKRDVERTNATAHGSRQRAFNANQKFAECFHGVFGQPIIEFVLRRLTSKNFKPSDLLFSTKRFRYCCIEYTNTGSPNVRPGAVSPDEGNDWLVRHLQLSFVDGNFLA